MLPVINRLFWFQLVGGHFKQIFYASFKNTLYLQSFGIGNSLLLQSVFISGGGLERDIPYPEQ